MGLSRRKFTREVKVTAIQRLDAGVSVAEVARAFEVNPNLLHRWGRSSGKVLATHFRVWGNGVGTRPKWRNWSARLVSRRWRSIF